MNLQGNGRKRKSKYGNPFYIQLEECFLTVAMLYGSYCLAGRLIYNSWWALGLVNSLLVGALMSGLAVLTLGLNGYFSFRTRPFAELAAKTLVAVVLIDLLFIAVLYFAKLTMLSPYFFATMGILQLAALLAIKRISEGWKRKILLGKTGLVIGNNTYGEDFLEQLKGKYLGRIAYVESGNPHLFDFIQQADDIFLVNQVEKSLKDRILSLCVQSGKKAAIVPETYEIAMQKAIITQVGDIPIFEVGAFALTDVQRLFKRLSDIMISLAGIVLASPIMLYAAVRIKREDRGPVFFRQIRAGRGGADFHVLKFRSMVIDAEKYTGAVFAAENDPRITRIGRLMRASRIDEIPQFFNVLKGNMSIVGPRPERPVFVEEFCKSIPEYRNRLMVKPGITGMAQVMGNYTTTAENKVKFDLMYIRNYSLLLDLKILFKTVGVVFTKSQAEGFTGKEGTVGLTEALTADAVLGARGEASKLVDRRKRRPERIGKVALIAVCCLMVLMSSVFLRYASILTVFAAALGGDGLTVTAMADEELPLDGDLSVEAGVGVVGGADGLQNTNFSQPVDGQPENLSSDEANAQTTGASTDGKGRSVVLTGDQINQSIKELTIVQLADIFFNFVSRLSRDDLVTLEQLARGGFTTEEKEEAKDMMYSYFDEDEVEYIKEIYRKIVG